MGLGSGIRDPEKTYSGSRGQKSTGSRIRNTEKVNIFLYQKLKITYVPPGLHKGHPALLFALLDLDPPDQNQYGSGSETLVKTQP